MIIFDNYNKIDLSNLICHSGGAEGSDLAFENYGEKYGIKIKAYSYKTKYHNSPNKIEISEEDYQEGIVEINKANRSLNRYGIHKYMNLLARNWPQVKYSNELYGIGSIVDPGKKSIDGYYSKSKLQTVSGGSGYAVQMSINHNRPVHIFDQLKNSWFRWSYTSFSFIEIDLPSINCQNFAGIGTRKINSNGLKAIEDLYSNTFSNKL